MKHQAHCSYHLEYPSPLDECTCTPYVVGSDTSKAAAESIVPQLPRLELLVYTFILNSGTDGATTDEIEYGTQLAHQTASARVRGLVLKGRIRDSGMRRNTRSGRKAAVWVVE